MIQILLFLIFCIHCSNGQSTERCRCLRDKFQLVNVLKSRGVVPCNASTITEIGLSNSPRMILYTIVHPVDILAIEDDVYVTPYYRAAIYKLNQEGVLQETFDLPGPSTIRPRFLELYDHQIYVTIDNGIMVSSNISIDEPVVFTSLLNLTILPNALRFTPDGEQFLLASESSSQVYVYNSNDLTIDRIINVSTTSNVVRDIQFDVLGNVYFSTRENVLKVYSSEYEYIRDIAYPNTNRLDGFIIQCDGTKLLVDQSNLILLTDRDDNVVESFRFILFTGVNALRTIAITSSGRTFVNNWTNNHVYVF